MKNLLDKSLWMIVYRENPKKFNKQLLEPINEFSRVSLQKSVVFLIAVNNCKMKFKKQSHLQWYKILNKFSKRCKDMYTESY